MKGNPLLVLPSVVIVTKPELAPLGTVRNKMVGLHMVTEAGTGVPDIS
jgi:hypothetical protein